VPPLPPVAMAASGGPSAAPSRPPALPASTAEGAHTHAAYVPAEVQAWAPRWPEGQAHWTLMPGTHTPGAVLVAVVVWPAAPSVLVWPPLRHTPPRCPHATSASPAACGDGSVWRDCNGATVARPAGIVNHGVVGGSVRTLRLRGSQFVNVE
jgi:hypothetical protein